MPATRLRGCLNRLGSSGSHQIEYIEVAYGYTAYLDNVCNAIHPGSSYDSSRTGSQPDACTSTAYMYPGHCGGGWLRGDCRNGCGNANYRGFYCKGI